MIEFKLTALKNTMPSEYALRFLFGGACTALAGVVAKQYGAEIGGLFLAFPAIFPASASLIEKHEEERKRRIGSDGKRRGRFAAGSDAAGASLGALSLVLFACIVWQSVRHLHPLTTIVLATVAWLIAAIGLWELRKRRFFLRRTRRAIH